MFIIKGILSAVDLKRIQGLVDQAHFLDGLVTASGAGKNVKNNREMEVSNKYVSVVEILDRAVESSDELNARLLPRFRTNPLINRYEGGMHYGEHLDKPIQGGDTQFGRARGRFGQNFIRTDYSMTLFLSDPTTYEGGELELRIFDESKLVKLEAGSAVCYSTGIRHSVRLVSKGARYAAIYWFQSIIRDPQIRATLWDQFLLERELRSAGLGELAQRAAAVRNNLIRYGAEI